MDNACEHVNFEALNPHNNRWSLHGTKTISHFHSMETILVRSMGSKFVVWTHMSIIWNCSCQWLFDNVMIMLATCGLWHIDKEHDVCRIAIEVAEDDDVSDDELLGMGFAHASKNQWPILRTVMWILVLWFAMPFPCSLTVFFPSQMRRRRRSKQPKQSILPTQCLLRQSSRRAAHVSSHCCWFARLQGWNSCQTCSFAS